jgi:hypothetical protein
MAWLLGRPVHPGRIVQSLLREQYSRGDRDRLWTASEFGRHSVIAGYVPHFAPDGAILDIGSGSDAGVP